MAKKPTTPNDPVQKTETGYEIPVPSKEDVMADLEKVAPKK